MERRRVGLAGIAVVSIIVLANLFFFTQPGHPLEPIPGLEWGVEVGDTFQFEVKTYGSTQGGLYYTEEIHTLNGTFIEVTIDELPSLDNIIAPWDLMQDVVLFSKVSSTFVNDSSIVVLLENILSEGISGCTLPIGNWETIASFYPYSGFKSGTSFEELASILYEDYLFLKYKWYGPYDDGGGWRGNSSLITGIPLNVIWRYTHQYPTIYVELILISS